MNNAYHTVAEKALRLLGKSQSPTNLKKATSMVRGALRKIPVEQVTLHPNEHLVRIDIRIAPQFFGWVPDTDVDEFWDSEACHPKVWEVLGCLVRGNDDPYYRSWDYTHDEETLTITLSL